MYTWTCKQKSNHVGDFPLETKKEASVCFETLSHAAIHIVEPKQQRKRKQLFPKLRKSLLSLDRYG